MMHTWTEVQMYINQHSLLYGVIFLPERKGRLIDLEHDGYAATTVQDAERVVRDLAVTGA